MRSRIELIAAIFLEVNDASTIFLGVWRKYWLFNHLFVRRDKFIMGGRFGRLEKASTVRRYCGSFPASKSFHISQNHVYIP